MTLIKLPSEAPRRNNAAATKKYIDQSALLLPFYLKEMRLLFNRLHENLSAIMDKILKYRRTNLD